MSNRVPGKRRNNGVALLGLSVLPVAGTACQRGTPAADASRATMAQEPRPVYVAAAVEGRLPRTVIVTGTPAAPEKTAPVREARAVLEEARLNRDRMAQLREKDLVARADFDAALSRLLVAESRYQAAIEEARNRQELPAERRSALSLARPRLADPGP